MALFSGKTKPSATDNTSGDTPLELDVFATIQAHVQWKQRLLRYIEGKSDEQLDPAMVGSDHLCALGKWIYGPGGKHYGDHPDFQALQDIHAKFHTYAAEVVNAVDAGEMERAMRLLQQGEYPKVSNRIKSMLASLSLAFDFH